MSERNCRSNFAQASTRSGRLMISLKRASSMATSCSRKTAMGAASPGAALRWRPQRDSNPCCRRERANRVQAAQVAPTTANYRLLAKLHNRLGVSPSRPDPSPPANSRRVLPKCCAVVTFLDKSHAARPIRSARLQPKESGRAASATRPRTESSRSQKPEGMTPAFRRHWPPGRLRNRPAVLGSKQRATSAASVS